MSPACRCCLRCGQPGHPGATHPCCAIASAGNGCPSPVPWFTNPMAAMLTSFFSCVLAPINSETLIEFLSELNELEQRRVLLIWDGLPSHRSRRMSDWIASQRHWLSVEPLPGYAPDVNPIEQAWGSIKSKELANLCSDTIDQVAEIAKDGLERIGSDAALCFAFLRHCGLRL